VLPSFVDSRIGFTQKLVDDMVDRLLGCPKIQRVLKLNERATPKHMSDFCSKNFTSELQLIDAILQ
jgi:hypothetical protein